MANLWIWAWNQKSCALHDVQRHMHSGEDAEVRSRHLSPTIPSLLGGPGLQITCVKRGHLFVSQHSFIQTKQKPGENFNLCFPVEFRFLAETVWSIFFYQVLVSGWYWST